MSIPVIMIFFFFFFDLVIMILMMVQYYNASNLHKVYEVLESIIYHFTKEEDNQYWVLDGW